MVVFMTQRKYERILFCIEISYYGVAVHFNLFFCTMNNVGREREGMLVMSFLYFRSSEI